MSTPTTYTARPRTVEAMQITEDTLPALEAWAGVRARTAHVPAPGGLSIGVRIRNAATKTTTTAAFGDYVTLAPVRVHARADFEAQFEASTAEAAPEAKATKATAK